MAINYVSDETGATVAVQIPIKEWLDLKQKYPEIGADEADVPEWQKTLVRNRMNAIKENPERLRPIEELLRELDEDDA